MTKARLRSQAVCVTARNAATCDQHTHKQTHPHTVVSHQGMVFNMPGRHTHCVALRRTSLNVRHGIIECRRLGLVQLITIMTGWWTFRPQW
jgi:hypothetical protein